MKDSAINALRTIAAFPVTDPKNQDAINIRAIAVSALASLKDELMEVKDGPEFETHRAAWRTAIADKVSSYSELDDPEGRYIYWKNELEKFDLAFDALLALRLPQS